MAPAHRAAHHIARRPSWIASARAITMLTVTRTLSPAVWGTMVVLMALPMVFALAFASRGYLSGDPIAFLVERNEQLVSALVTPMVALLLSTSAFSAEHDDGTLIYLLTTTTPRWWIVTVRLLFAMIGTILVSTVTVLAMGWIATGGYDPAHVTRAYAAAALVGGAAYSALFTLLAVRAKRALVSGLVYIIFWEGVLSTTFRALDYVSVRQWMRAVARALVEVPDMAPATGPSVRAACIGLAVVMVLAVTLGARRLARPRLTRH